MSGSCERRVRTEIGPLNIGTGANRRRPAAGQDRSVHHHRQAVGEREDGVHVVFDQRDRVIQRQLFEESHYSRRLVGAHAGERLGPGGGGGAGGRGGGGVWERKWAFAGAFPARGKAPPPRGAGRGEGPTTE